ncbi:uncharacterized protein [Leptinotarsa decemlineata]|uniref:uncharacterized protein n=1 Tax=Leptinotarsa decemlineata TaxID=7539 RepID=UPI000C252ECF|nr:uncharacterized protein LOC111507750 [Leptinotarsa decemlineata]
MGLSCTKIENPEVGRGVTIGGTNENEEVDIIVDTEVKYHAETIEEIKKDLKFSPQIFLLNNMLMSVQFFENYTKEMLQLFHANGNRMEKELNRTLFQNEVMECTCPDVIFDRVNKNIRYRPLHGPKKHSFGLLTARRIFVINDKIEVVKGEDIPQYTSIDKPFYQFKIEKSSRRGFIRLRYIDASKVSKVPDDTDVTYEPIPGTSNSSDSDMYEYRTITDLRTPKRIQIERLPERRDTLPNTCFTTRKIRKADTDLLETNENGENMVLKEEDLVDTVTYIDAEGFMNHFKNVLFPNSVGRALGFDATEISLTDSIPGKVFCNLSDEEDNPLPCEVIPCVKIPWPAEQAFEFKLREDRPTITDLRTGIRFKWPTDDMIKEITSMNCVAVPKGYWMKKGENPDASIEWEIAFPKAERFLEARMSSEQMRCFLFLLVLHKTYIEPYTKHNGLLVEHIRCHMYWECEANYRDWPQHRLGLRLLKVISNLADRLAQNDMPDFFIRNNNLFRNIPNMYLQFAQKVLHDVLQAPTMYFLRALRNIQYASGDFYTPLDFKDLYKTIDPVPHINIFRPNLAILNMRQKKYQDTETQLRHLRELENRRKWTERKMNLIMKENERRESVDSINLDWVCEKEFDIHKRRNILTQFVDIFIEIAKDSAKIGSQTQTRFFLKQAYYLTRIIENTSAEFISDARDTLELIASLEKDCNKRIATDDNVPPMTPARNSVQIDSSISHQLRNNTINLNNLNMSYNMTGTPLKESQSFHMKKKPPHINRVKSVDPSTTRKSVSFV